MAPPSGDDGALDERATTLSGGMERHSTTLFERQATTLDAHGSLIGRRSTDGQMERRSTDFMLSPQATAVRDEAWPAPPPPAAEPPAYAPPADLPPPAWLGACGDEAAGAAAGSYEDAGKRASMEDTELVIPRCCGAPGATLLGIFDGHR